MEPYKTSTSTARRLLHSMLYGIALWAVVMVGVLFWGAGAIRHMPVGGSTDIAIGPLSFLHAAKEAQGNGFTLAFAMQSGVVILGLICCAVEIFVAMAPVIADRFHQRSISHSSKK